MCLILDYMVEPEIDIGGLSELTNWYDEGHAEKLASQSPLDLVQEVVVARAQMAEDEAELCQGPVEHIVVVLDDLVPVLLPVLPRRRGQQEVREVGGGAEVLRRMEVYNVALLADAALLVLSEHQVAHPHVAVTDRVESRAQRIRRPPQFKQELKDFVGNFAQLQDVLL